MTAPLHAKEFDEFQRVLEAEGLNAALCFLNGRTSYRFTGVYRFDGETLRNVALCDRWSPASLKGADKPAVDTFCAIVRTQGDALCVVDGTTDPRFPWMASNPVACYCGVLVRDEQGEPLGTLCHFDVQRCEPPRSELDLMLQVGPLVRRFMETEVT